MYQPADFYPRSPCGERRADCNCRSADPDFYPRSPCGERQARRASRQQPAGISIHALLAESDRRRTYRQGEEREFLSTLSLRRATTPLISRITRRQYFYPRSPCGERPSKKYPAILGSVISIHALLAESDWWLRCWQLAARDISIHALLAESDRYRSCVPLVGCSFLSTLSLRRATGAECLRL